jgi:hypothetical protein
MVDNFELASHSGIPLLFCELKSDRNCQTNSPACTMATRTNMAVSRAPQRGLEVPAKNPTGSQNWDRLRE